MRQDCGLAQVFFPAINIEIVNISMCGVAKHHTLTPHFCGFLAYIARQDKKNAFISYHHFINGKIHP